MSALALYMTPFMTAYSLLAYSHYFITGILLAYLLNATRHCCMRNKSAPKLAQKEVDLNTHVRTLTVNLTTLENKVDILNTFMETLLDTHLYAIQRRILKTELRIDAINALMARQKIVSDGQAEDNSFACEIASAAYVPLKPQITYMEEPLTEYLSKSPATARELVKHFSENKNLLNPKFFSHGTILTRHVVNSCLYYLLHKKRVNKSDTTPPVWTVNTD